MFLPEGALSACGFASDTDRQKSSVRRTRAWFRSSRSCDILYASRWTDRRHRCPHALSDRGLQDEYPPPAFGARFSGRDRRHALGTGPGRKRQLRHLDQRQRARVQLPASPHRQRPGPQLQAFSDGRRLDQQCAKRLRQQRHAPQPRRHAHGPRHEGARRTQLDRQRRTGRRRNAAPQQGVLRGQRLRRRPRPRPADEPLRRQEEIHPLRPVL